MTALSPQSASVIVACRGRLAATRACLASLARHTRPPWELSTVFDSGDRRTADYLAGVADAASFPVVLAGRATPPGGPGRLGQAWAVGRDAASGELLVLLDNEVVVTDAWLDQLEALARADPAIGLVGPMSNGFPPPQWAPSPPRAGLEALDRFARDWRAARRGRWFTAESLASSCLLVTRAAREALDSPGDDGDFCGRIRAAGLELAVAHDLFVSRGAITEGEPEAAAGASGRGPSAVAAARPTVSLTMIVRDEQRNLPDCLASARGLFDELVVVDTGSADRTAELARGFGARVSGFAWVDDFAAARNAALERAAGDYAFWLDADDRIPPEQVPRLQALLRGLRRGDEAAYVVRCACDPDEHGHGAAVVDHVRLFPRRPGVRWEYRVHEQILPSLRRAGIPVRWSDAMVRHVGYADAATRRRKLDRDRAILAEELAARPDDPFVRFNLGAIAVELADWAAAVPDLERALARSAPGDSITGKLHALLARAHQGLGDDAAALAICERGLDSEPDDAELLFRKAVLHRRAGQADQAEACWNRVLRLRPPERFRSVDTGIHGHLTRRNLAALAAGRGAWGEARAHWEAVLAECPGDLEASAALGWLLGGEPERPPPAGVDSRRGGGRR